MQYIVLTIKTLLSNVAKHFINTRLVRELFETVLCQFSDFFHIFEYFCLDVNIACLILLIILRHFVYFQS